MSQISFSNKTIAREYAFKFIYKLFLEDFNDDKSAITADKVKLDSTILEFEESYLKEDEEHTGNELNPAIQEHGKLLIKGYLEKENEIVESVMSYVKGRSFSSIGNIEKSVLCLGAYELIALDTPAKVVINEYINLVKKFGTKESSSFINGILDKMAKSK